MDICSFNCSLLCILFRLVHAANNREIVVKNETIKNQADEVSHWTITIYVFMYNEFLF
jgi:hypothetical protein